jgi:hypothetical protein
VHIAVPARDTTRRGRRAREKPRAETRTAETRVEQEHERSPRDRELRGHERPHGKRAPTYITRVF